MSLRINSEQQRIEGSGKVATGNWTNATYFRVGNLVTVTSVGHTFVDTEELEIDVTSGAATSGNYEITVVNSDSFTFNDAASGTITAGNTLSYRTRRSLVLTAEDKLGINVGIGGDERSAIIVTKDALGDVRVGINNTNPIYELDVEGQIRTTRSIISDTATIINLDIGTIVNPELNLRAPNLVNYTDTDVTSPTYQQTFFPTADTPDLSDQSRRIATTDFVYKVATNDTGGRVYVSSTIGSDDNDGRSAARPLRSIKKAAQVAYGLQKATPDASDEYVSIIVSGGEYLEDNPISLPRNCSLIGDNLRRVVVRPLNSDRHMVKASNETYINGVTFRDALQNPNDPFSATLFTWKYAFVFDDKQRLYYEPELKQVPAQAGDKYRGDNVQLLTFIDNTGTNTDLQVGYIVTNEQGAIVGTVQSVTFTGPVATPYSTGSMTVLVTSGQDDVFSSTDTVYYAATLGQVLNDPNNPPVSNNAGLIDVESLRPELETISNQIYQHTFDSERETILVNGASVNDATDLITVTAHGLYTGAAVYYDNDGNTSIPGLINQRVYYVRVLTANTFELYDTFTNANLDAASTTKQGRIDITAVGANTHYLTTGKVMPESDEIYIQRHQFATGDQVTYRASKMDAIGGLTDNTSYFVYVKNVNWIKLSTSEANAIRKDPSGNDDPVTINLTSAGKGFQRLDLQERILPITTIDTSLNTQTTYSGPILNLGSTSYHDYEVGQEVNLYGFQSSAVDFGGSAVYSYSQSGTTIDCTITGVDIATTTAIWGNLQGLGEAGLKFNFTTGGAISKTYHCDEFVTGTAFPSLGSTLLGLAKGTFDTGTSTVRFRLNAPDSATRSGSFAIFDNIEDLNGRKYITHRIERADGFSLAFVVRGNYSRFGAAIDIVGDQSVCSASNYVLASLRNSPYGFNAVSQTDRYRDGAEAIRVNQEFIAEEAYAYIKSHHTSSSTRGTQISIGGTNYTSITSNARTGTYSVSGATLTVTVPLGHAGYALQSYSFTFSGVLANGSYEVSDTPDYRTFTIILPNSNNSGETGTVTFTTPLPHVTPGSKPQSDRYADASSLILTNRVMIAEMAVERMVAEESFTIPTGNQSCKDDTVDFLKALAYNLTFGGNDQVYDAAKYYVDGAHVVGEEDESVIVFNYARDLAIAAMRNETFDSAFTTYNLGGYTQVKDATVTQDIQSPACQDVASSITTLTAVVTQAIGSTGSPGNLNGVTRTYATGDQQCIDDIVKVLRAWQYDLRYTGNSATAEAVNKYINSGAIQFIAGEVDFSRQVYAYSKELANLSILNDLGTGTFSQIVPTANGAVTVDPLNCSNVTSALTTLWTSLDTALSTSTAITSITYPDPILTELGSSLYSFTLSNVFLDLPIIEASPYIQNSSLISFQGGSGCEIDGAKVATPNVPRPGLKLDSLGNTVALYDPQGKSMVASAFTIISFGGTAYNILNDGYTQLVSVFAIFCQDGIVCQSGGYASVTNSASNFGTYALRATGYRSEPYSFDIGTITSVQNQTDANGANTGRQEITIAGSLTNIPIEDYIIKIDGFTNTNPALEYIILETEVISGSAGSSVVATIVTNQKLDLTETATSTQYSYDLGNIAGGGSSPLVGATIKLHRPSVVNSSSHTWEYSGSGNTYAALPQNGGVGRGSSFEAREEEFGQVYTSGTNEFGDFKVGDFVTIFNRTGAISFVGTVAISELTSIKITGGDITITGFSNDDNLGGAFASEEILPTQFAVRSYISNNLGPYLNQPYSTNAVPSALVQLTATGKINIDQIPALRPFNITSVNSTQERLALEDVVAGDIAIETTTQTFNVTPSDVDTSTEEITIISHALTTGDGLIYSQGTTNIGGLANANTYYVIVVDQDTIKLAATESDAANGTAINLTSQGTGTQVFTTQGIAVSYILENDLDSQYVTFAPNSGYTFTNSNLIVGSSTDARGVITDYNDGAVFRYDINIAGSGYTNDFALTISAPDDTINGVQAAATANVTSGSVVSVTITNLGKGYYSAPTVTVPTSPAGALNNADIAGAVEGRVYVDIANNIKFDSGDFILDGSGANLGTGTYDQSAVDGQGNPINTTTIVVTETAHGLSTSDLVYLDFTSGTAPDGFFTITVLNNNQYQVTTTTASTTSGNVARKRIVDILRAVNTSASDAANWTQLTSTNIDASNIVSGTIDPQRLASRGTANNFTFLRGDSSYEYALQSIRPETSDVMVITGSVTDTTYIDTITINNGGAGYTDGTYQNIPMEGGTAAQGGAAITAADDNVARATYIVTSGVITSASVTDSGSGYAANFSLTVPSELGSPSQAATLTANKGTVARAYGDIRVDVRKANNATSQAAGVYGNYGVAKFRKAAADQALANQTEAGFIVSANGEVSLDQGTGSKLTAEFIESAGTKLSASDLIDASLFTQGTLDPARIAAGTYGISITGTAAKATTVNVDEVGITSNPAPSGAAAGLELHTRNNSAVSLTDGGTKAGILTFRRQSINQTRAVTQIGFTDNNNLWVRGDSGGANGQTAYSDWYEIWSSGNDGRSNLTAGTGVNQASTLAPNAGYLDGQSGLWYQSGHNVGDRRGHGKIGIGVIPEVLGRDKYVLNNFRVHATGNKFEFYVPNFHVNSGPSGNIANSGTYTLYEDANATQNIGTFTVDPAGVTEGTGNDGAIYSTITGTASFTAGKNGENVYLIGPSASGSTRWTVTSANELVASSAQLLAVLNDANGAILELGKDGVSTVPKIEFRSSGQATAYDVQLQVSGGSATNGEGTLRINAGDVTINGNTVWHSGNDGATSELDARYLQGAEPATTATASTIVKRDASGNINGVDFAGDQITLTNTGTSILNLADANGITLGKAGTNILSVIGKGNANTGYIRFGNDTRDFGWDGTSLSYGGVYFRSSRLGIGVTNPLTNIHIQSGTATNDGDGSAGLTQTGTEAMLIDLPAFTVGETYGSIAWMSGTRRRAMISAIAENTDGDYVGLTFYTQGTDGAGDFFESMRIARSGNVGIGNFAAGTPGAKLDVKGIIRTDNRFDSTVATGTAPITVTSTTECTNLNAARLQGYTALGLPYLGGSTNTNINSTDGVRRFYFSNNSYTAFNTADNYYFQSGTANRATMHADGKWNFAGNGDTQTSYRMQVLGASGLNVEAVTLANGQNTSVLRASGDAQWVDSYGVFKRNRQTVGENITVAATDNCMSAGPITINNNTTVTISNGGSWSIV
jgi:hypothetical protein